MATAHGDVRTRGRRGEARVDAETLCARGTGAELWHVLAGTRCDPGKRRGPRCPGGRRNRRRTVRRGPGRLTHSERVREREAAAGRPPLLGWASAAPDCWSRRSGVGPWHFRRLRAGRDRRPSAGRDV